jgi:hypothetical protein
LFAANFELKPDTVFDDLFFWCRILNDVNCSLLLYLAGNKCLCTHQHSLTSWMAVGHCVPFVSATYVYKLSHIHHKFPFTGGLSRLVSIRTSSVFSKSSLRNIWR